jgi:hypothetical protein
MSTLLYLDTARLGLMSEPARRAHQDYIRLAGKEGCSLYFDRFLRSGFHAWPTRMQREYPHLRDWQGVAELKTSLRSLVHLHHDAPVLLANRSAQLMRLAARLLVERSHRILVTDLAWPSYRRILEQERLESDVGVTTVPIRDAVFGGRVSEAKLIRRIVLHYENLNCDSLFIPAVSHDGIRLPVDSICQKIAQVRKPRFVVVDGAQAFCHVPVQSVMEHCNFFLAGCHKWLQGHVPMGGGFLPNRESAGRIESASNRMLMTGELDDPLMVFTRQLEGDSLEMFSETVSLSSLFASQAAIRAQQNSRVSLSESLEHRISNAQILADAMHGTGWSAFLPNGPFRTGMLLAQIEHPGRREIPAAKRRDFFLAHGIAVTCYENGSIRISVPDRPWRKGELDLIRWALRWSSGIDDCQSQNDPATVALATA